MKVVLDTNVLISAVFFGGLPGQILEAWKGGQVTLVLSPAIIEEYQRVGEELEGKHGNLGFSALLAVVVGHSEIVDPVTDAGQIARDPDDDKFLRCAAAADASIVVSGDEDLLTLVSWNDVEILSPRTFVDAYLSGNRS